MCPMKQKSSKLLQSFYPMAIGSFSFERIDLSVESKTLVCSRNTLFKSFLLYMTEYKCLIHFFMLTLSIYLPQIQTETVTKAD